MIIKIFKLKFLKCAVILFETTQAIFSLNIFKKYIIIIKL